MQTCLQVKLCKCSCHLENRTDGYLVVLKPMSKETFVFCYVVYGFQFLCSEVHRSLFICVCSNYMDVSAVCSFTLVPLHVTV